MSFYNTALSIIHKNDRFTNKVKKLGNLNDEQQSSIAKALVDNRNLNMIEAFDEVLDHKYYNNIFSIIIREFDESDKYIKLISKIVNRNTICDKVDILTIAITENKSSIVEYYISVHQNTKFNFSHLSLAINNGFEDIARLIIATQHVDIQARLNDWWLVYACKRCSFDFIKFLVEEIHVSFARDKIALDTLKRRGDKMLIDYIEKASILRKEK